MIVDFQDTKTAFAWASDFDLQKMALLYRAMGKPVVSDYGARLASLAMKIHLPIKPIVRYTVFEQFCGGETLEQCKPVIAQLAQYNVGTTLDYSAEGGGDEESFNETRDEILRGIAFAKDRDEVHFVVFKLSGLADGQLLEKIDAGTKLSAAEQKSHNRLIERVEEICQAAKKAKVRVFLDAEESWVQDATDQIAEDMMRRYNQTDPVVYTTVQMYRKDRLAYLKHIIKRARQEKFLIGVKLVRGAYMEKERERAKQLKISSPIQPNKAATDQAYNDALVLLVQSLDCAAFCAGTHNLQSTKLLTELCEKHQIVANDKRVEFSQLYGMSANLTFNLAKAGFNVSKYLPYGPIHRVMPYLTRRAQENTAIRGQTGRELALILEEIKRRKEDHAHVSSHASVSEHP